MNLPCVTSVVCKRPDFCDDNTFHTWRVQGGHVDWVARPQWSACSGPEEAGAGSSGDVCLWLVPRLVGSWHCGEQNPELTVFGPWSTQATELSHRLALGLRFHL